MLKSRPPQLAPKPGPVKLPKGSIIANRWRIRSLGEGGCGAVYAVEDLKTPGDCAVLKTESNFVCGENVLKLEALVLQKMTGKRHVAQLLHAGKKSQYSYIVMTQLGDTLDKVVKECGETVGVSTQKRIALNILSGLKELHDVGFLHRDVNPRNIALGRQGTKRNRFLYILDFGLAREFVVKNAEDREKLRIRTPRA